MDVGTIKKKTPELLSAEICNTGRQTELDIGKALPILCLAFVHCVIECCTEEQLLSGIPFLFDSVIGGPFSAPMFLFCMGATIHYTKRNSPEEIALRGLSLLRAGFLLNVFRFLLPFLLGYAITGNTRQYLVPLPYFFFGNDVLQFACLSMLCIALFKKLKTPKWAMAAVSLAMSAAGTFLRGTDLGNDVLNVVLGWFIGTENEAGLVISDFPLLNWLIVPVCGYLFGSLLLHVKDKKRFYLLVSPALVAALLIMVVEIRFVVGTFSPGENAFYHLFLYDALWFLAIIPGLLGVYYGASKILPERLVGFFTYTSRHITEFYCIHWVLVRLITNVALFSLFGTQVLPLRYVLLLSLGISLTTFLCIVVYDTFLNMHKGKSAE